MAGTTSLVKMWVAGNIWKYKANPDSPWLPKTKTEVQMISSKIVLITVKIGTLLNKLVTSSLELCTS